MFSPLAVTAQRALIASEPIIQLAHAAHGFLCVALKTPGFLRERLPTASAGPICCPVKEIH